MTKTLTSNRTLHYSACCSYPKMTFLERMLNAYQLQYSGRRIGTLDFRLILYYMTLMKLFRAILNLISGSLETREIVRAI